MEKILSNLSIAELNELDEMTYKKEDNMFKSMNKGSYKRRQRKTETEKDQQSNANKCDLTSEGPIQNQNDLGKFWSSFLKFLFDVIYFQNLREFLKRFQLRLIL